MCVTDHVMLDFACRTFKVGLKVFGHVLIEILHRVWEIVTNSRLQHTQNKQTSRWIKTTSYKMIHMVFNCKVYSWMFLTFLRAIFSVKAWHCLKISYPGLWKVLRKSMKCCVTWSDSALGCRLRDELWLTAVCEDPPSVNNRPNVNQMWIQTASIGVDLIRFWFDSAFCVTVRVWMTATFMGSESEGKNKTVICLTPSSSQQHDWVLSSYFSARLYKVSYVLLIRCVLNLVL